MLARLRLYQALKRDILSGRYRMGERLPVGDLALQHGVSKTPVREALSSLQHEGLVRTVPRVGYFVAEMSVERVQDLFQLRLILEGASAELAAEHITETELLQLERIPCSWVLADMDSCLAYLADNRAFHCGVAAASRNSVLSELVGRLLDQTQALLLWELELRNHPEEFADEHRQLVRALRSHDGTLARRAMVRAIETTRQTLLGTIMGDSRFPIASTDGAAN
jgi:DNA-binding GntR family transcriptional regulator